MVNSGYWSDFVVVALGHKSGIRVLFLLRGLGQSQFRRCLSRWDFFQASATPRGFIALRSNGPPCHFLSFLDAPDAGCFA